MSWPSHHKTRMAMFMGPPQEAAAAAHTQKACDATAERALAETRAQSDLVHHGSVPHRVHGLQVVCL